MELFLVVTSLKKTENVTQSKKTFLQRNITGSRSAMRESNAASPPGSSSSSSSPVGPDRLSVGPEVFRGPAGPGRTDPDPSFPRSPTETPSGWCE